MLNDFKIIFTNPEAFNYVVEGFTNTLLVTVIAALIGLAIGFVVAIVKISAGQFKFMKIPAIICDVYTTVIRGTPVALQLFIMVFSLFAIRGFKPYAVILTFGINSGAYISENIRAGISSTDSGQMEAGRALGLSWTKTMIKIIMPQAIKNIIPAIGNEMIALLKETAIVSMVGATVGTLTFDLNTASTTIYYAKNIGVSSYLSCAIVAGLLYLIVVYFMVWVVKLLERRMGRSERRH